MSTPPDNPNDDVEGIEENGPSRDGEIEVFLEPLVSALSGFTEQEKHRIAVQREVALRTLEATQEVERLQHDLSIKRIEAEDEQDKRRHVRVVIAICLGIGFPMALLALVLVTALFGSERQSQIALDVLKIAGIAIGGGGFIFGAAYAINRLIRN